MSTYDNMTEDEKTFVQMCEKVVKAKGWNWDYMVEHYSFPSAYRQGMTPENAVDDADSWLSD